jgi:recombination protein RecR
MNPAYTKSLNELIDEFSNLPGIGKKTAERLAFHILKVDRKDALGLAKAIHDVKNNTRHCAVCFNLSEEEKCAICQDQRRDHSVVCVVEQSKDIISLEKTGLCKWVYHVLGGHIAPLDGIEPSDLTINALMQRVRNQGVTEVIMATNPNIEGDGTALYIGSLLKPLNVKVTRLARGLPTGSTIEFASGSILVDAIIGRATID